MSGLLNSVSASSAAFFIDCAAMPALPPADIGSTRPTRTLPVPMAALGGGAALGGDGEADPRLPVDGLIAAQAHRSPAATVATAASHARPARVNLSASTRRNIVASPLVTAATVTHPRGYL